MAKKITENAVLFVGDTQVFVTKRGKDGTIYREGVPRGVETDTIFLDGAGTEHPRESIAVHGITDVQTALAFLDGHNALPIKPRSGFDTFYNNNGPTNAESPRELTPDGKLRCILVFMQGLHLDVTKGGQTGEDAVTALRIVGEYGEHANKGVEKIIAAQKLAARAAQAEQLGITVEELDAFMAQRAAKAAKKAAKGKGNKAPEATVPADQADDNADTEEHSDAEQEAATA